MTKKHSLFIIAMTYLSLFGLGLTDTLRGALFPAILSSFSLTSSEGSWFFIMTSTFSILAGYSTHSLSQRLSIFNTWRAGVFFMALGALLIFLAPTFMVTLLGCASLGIGFGILAVTQNVLITTVSPPSLKKKILSGLHSMYGLASFLAPMGVAQFALQQWPWRTLFLVASLLVFLLLCSSYYLRHPEISAPHPENLEIDNSSMFEKSKLLFAIMVSSYVAMEILISTRLTTYLTQHLHWPLEQASLYLTYFFVALLSGRLLFSLLHFPISTKKTLLLALLGALLMTLLGLRIDPFFLTLTGFFMAPFYPLAMALLAEQFPTKLSPMISLTISLQSLFVIIMNLIMGPLTDHFGIDFAMNSMFVFGGLSWFLLMLI